MNHTTNYNLSQWDAEDKVQRVDFNADNAKIDAAIKAVDGRVDSLSSTVSGKASASEVSSLQGSVNSISSILSQKGNCSAEFFTLNGLTAVGTPVTGGSLSFSTRPDVFFLTGDSFFLMGQGGGSNARGIFYHSMSGSLWFRALSASWSGNTVTFTFNDECQNAMLSKNTAILIAAFRKVA